MKLKTALTILASLILVVFVALAALLTNTTNLLGLAVRDLAKGAENVRAAEQLKSRLLVHNRNAFLYSLHHDPARLESKVTQRAEILSRVETLGHLLGPLDEEPTVAAVKSEIATYFETRDRLNASNLSSIEQYNQVSQDVDDAMAAINKLVEVNHAQMRELVADIERRNQAADRAAMVLLSTGSLILIGLIAGIIYLVARPLASFMNIIAAYSAGKTSVRAAPQGLWETRQVAATFNLMAERLEEKRRDQLNFIAAIAHDLRNPLHAMSMAAAMLLRKTERKDQSLSDIIFRQINNLDRLARDLMDTTRIESGQLEIELALQDVNALIRDAVELHRNDSSLHNIKLETQGGPLQFSCDGGRITQVMNNLISNAIKYSPSGGTITVKSWTESGQIHISVSDQGMGIAPEDLDHIFTPFHRTSATKHTIPGIGLGLSASRHIVEAHGGKLNVDSKCNIGSTFRISLPTPADAQLAETRCESLHGNVATLAG